MGKYCSNCGQEVNASQDVCLNCGHELKQTNQVQDEGDTIGWAVLGFFIPIAGLILYLVWQQDRPKAAKSAGKGALISVVIAAVLYGFMITAMMSSSY